jgi:Uma2 family endonuclease
MSDDFHYVVNDQMGESGLQSFVVHILLDLLKSWFEAMERTMLVGENQFFYWKKGQPGLAPDLYVVEDEPTPLKTVRAWKVWERRGKVPSLVLEVVSDEYEKDYDPAQIASYEQLGVRELVRYDPEARRVRRPGIYGPRRVLSHFVRNEDGRLIEQPVDLRRGLRSSLYGFYLIPASDESLRIAVGPYRRGLWPLAEERAAAEAERAAAEAERAAAEAERAAAEAERAAAEAERAAAEAERADTAELEVQRLRAELERLRAER